MLKSRITPGEADWEPAFFGEGMGDQAASGLASIRRDREFSCRENASLPKDGEILSGSSTDECLRTCWVHGSQSGRPQPLQNVLKGRKWGTEEGAS